MKLNTPLPQPLPKECLKAAKIFKSFVDGGNNGLDGVIPRAVLENAKGFAIFTIFKAGFLFSARAGSGIVIAKLDDGTWSAPSAIGTAGLGFGGQAGAEMTDFLVVLNSRSAIKSFMSAGSLTLGGNMSIAVGPLGRNGEASGSLSTSGKVAAMYSYSKTKGLFGGVSIEGSVIMERQDANSLAYNSDVSVRMLLSGSVDPPEWASPLIKTLEACTGLPGNRKWIQDNDYSEGDRGYAFSGVGSPRGENGPSFLKKKVPGTKSSFPPASWGKQKESGSYFSGEDRVDELGDITSSPTTSRAVQSTGAANGWEAQFDSDYAAEPPKQTHRSSYSMPQVPTNNQYEPDSPFNSLPPFPSAQAMTKANSHSKSQSVSSPFGSTTRSSSYNPFSGDAPYASRDADLIGSQPRGSPPQFSSKPGLDKPLLPQEGVARAIALYDFRAVESGDLSFSQGDVITITQKSDSTDDWWTGTMKGKSGIFPANFVELV